MAWLTGYITVKDSEGEDRDVNISHVLDAIGAKSIVKEVGESGLLEEIAIDEVVAYYDKDLIMGEIRYQYSIVDLISINDVIDEFTAEELLRNMDVSDIVDWVKYDLRSKDRLKLINLILELLKS